MTAVLKHELRAYFHSLTAYVFGAFLLAFVGIGAMMYNLQAAVSNFEYVLSFGCLVFVVIVPILTMRVIAEERRQKTDQLAAMQHRGRRHRSAAFRKRQARHHKDIRCAAVYALLQNLIDVDLHIALYPAERPQRSFRCFREEFGGGNTLPNN